MTNILKNGKTTWIIPDKKENEEHVKQMKQYDCFKKYADQTLIWLYNRGVRTDKDFVAMNDDNLNHLIDPRTITDMEKACDILNQAIENQYQPNHPVIIGGIFDYDCDGLMSMTVVKRGLKMIYGDKVRLNAWINRRDYEGYGLCNASIDHLFKQNSNTSVIITGDNGCVALDSYEYARKTYNKDLKIIVTDHHETKIDQKTGKQILPKAIDALVDLHRLDDETTKKNPDKKDVKDICGAQLLFQMMRLLSQKFNPEAYSKVLTLVDLLVIAALGDVMSLRPGSDTRIEVLAGLHKINSTPKGPNSWGGRASIRALADQYRLRTPLSTTDFNFKINPTINSIGRVLSQDSPKLAMRLFNVNNYEDVYSTAQAMATVNDNRKSIVQKAMADIADNGGIDDNHKMIIYFAKDTPTGVAGILAGQLLEKYQRPTLVLTEGVDGKSIKGSGRSIPGFNINKVCLDAGSQFGDKFSGGGHAEANGVVLDNSIKDDYINALYKLTDEILDADVLNKTYKPDFVVTDKDTNLSEVIDEISSFDPIGQNFEAPLILYRNAISTSVTVLGKDNPVHIKINTPTHSIIWFNGRAEFETKFGSQIKPGKKFSAIGELSKSLYGDPQLLVTGKEVISE